MEIKNKLKYITVTKTSEQEKQNITTTTETKVVKENGIYVQKTITNENKSTVMKNVDLYDEAGNVIGKHKIPVMETITTEVREPEMDENNQPVYEPDLDENGQVQYVEEYDMKYVKLDGSFITQEEYNVCQVVENDNIRYTVNKEPVFKMAFVGCTYHCG